MVDYVNGKHDGEPLEILFENQNKKIEALHDTIKEGNELIAGSIGKLTSEVVSELRQQRTDLIAPATGRNQVSLTAVILLFGGMFVFMFISNIKDSNKSLHVDSKGIHIETEK